MTTPRRVVLIGMMGSGKTTIGRLLAARTAWPYYDNDALLADAAGRSARDISAEGRAVLRRFEIQALEAGLSRPEPSIIGIAGGVLEDQRALHLLEGGGVVVWLRAEPATLAARAARGAHRPWLEADARAWMSVTNRRRAAGYANLADLTIDTDRMDPSAAVDMILAFLRSHGGEGWSRGVLAADPE